MKRTQRPYVICHMASSIDGRIVTSHWKLPPGLGAQYERTAQSLDGDAWIVGRISMEPYAGAARVPKRRGARRSVRVPRTDFVARRDAKSYAVAVDPSGKLRWESNAIDEDHVVTVLSERVGDDYLAFLRAQGVSYVFGGRRHIELGRVLHKLRSRFGIERLLLEGGGKVNGSFLAAGLVDELSVLVVPVADGGVGVPTLFDAAEGKGPARRMELVSVAKRPGGLVWLRYRLRV